jgi:hypothetical protein
MNVLSTVDMMEVTRLTREGRLEEAMAALQGALPCAPPSGAPSNFAGDVRQAPTGPASPILHMVPPSLGTGGSWKAPLFSQSWSSWGMNPPHVPEALSGLLNRTGQLGSARLGRLSGRAVRDAPAPQPDMAQFEERTYANEAGSRTYKLYVPGGYNGQAMPLVVMLHGSNQSPAISATPTCSSRGRRRRPRPRHVRGAGRLGKSHLFHPLLGCLASNSRGEVVFRPAARP